MRLLYECSKTVFLGGSIIPNVGGHNPIEPAEHECAVIHGPFIENNSSLYNILNNPLELTVEVTYKHFIKFN